MFWRGDEEEDGDLYILDRVNSLQECRTQTTILHLFLEFPFTIPVLLT